MFHTNLCHKNLCRNIKIFCSEDLFWFQSYWNRDILHRNFRLLFGNSMVVIQTLFTNLTLLSHIRSPTVAHDWFAVVLCKSWRVPCVGQEMFTLSGNLISLPLGSSWLHPFIIYTLLDVSVLGLCLRIGDSGLSAWISLTALSRTYFITIS